MAIKQALQAYGALAGFFLSFWFLLYLELMFGHFNEAYAIILAILFVEPFCVIYANVFAARQKPPESTELHPQLEDLTPLEVAYFFKNGNLAYREQMARVVQVALAEIWAKGGARFEGKDSREIVQEIPQQRLDPPTHKVWTFITPGKTAQDLAKERWWDLQYVWNGTRQSLLEKGLLWRNTRAISYYKWVLVLILGLDIVCIPLGGISGRSSLLGMLYTPSIILVLLFWVCSAALYHGFGDYQPTENGKRCQDHLPILLRAHAARVVEHLIKLKNQTAIFPEVKRYFGYLFLFLEGLPVKTSIKHWLEEVNRRCVYETGTSCVSQDEMFHLKAIVDNLAFDPKSLKKSRG